MSISDIRNKIKYILKNIAIFMAHKDTLLAVIIFSTAVSSFSIGALSASGNNNSSKIVFNQIQEPVYDKKTPESSEASNNTDNIKNQTSTIFASRNGTKYYYSWCKSGNRVKPANRVYYDTKEHAEATGKTLASSCSK